VEQYDVGSSGLCVSVLNMLAGKSVGLVPYRTLTTLGGPRAEMGLYFLGFCDGATGSKG